MSLGLSPRSSFLSLNIIKKTIVIVGISFYSAFFVKAGFAVSSGAVMVLSIIKWGKREKK